MAKQMKAYAIVRLADGQIVGAHVNSRITPLRQELRMWMSGFERYAIVTLTYTLPAPRKAKSATSGKKKGAAK